MKAEDKIIDFVLSIPIDEWSEYQTTVNGRLIQIGKSSQCNAMVLIEGESFFSEKLNSLYYTLYDKKQAVEDDKKQRRLEGIYERLTGMPTPGKV